MTVGQKASLSLLVAVLLFAVFAVAAFSGLFNVLESRFYNPVITRQYESALEATAKAIDVYHGLNHGRFAPVLAIDAVKRSFLPNLSMEDTVARENEFGKLKAVTPGLAGIRLIDQNGKRIHYSTWTIDVLRRGAGEVLYRDYGKEDDAPFADIALPDAEGWKVRLDERKGLFLYSLPFVDGFGLFRGTAVFSVAPAGLMDSLLRSGLVQVGDSLTPAGANGIILRVPAAGSALLAAKVAEAWSQSLGSVPIAIGDPAAGASWVLISRGGSGGSHVGIILPAATFQIPGAMKVLLLLAFFLTAYLLIFLISNLRHDRGVIIAERIKRYHIGVIEGTWSEKAETDLGRWRRQLESRKSEYREGIKADLGKLGKSAEAEANELIDKSWDEIMSVLDRREQEESRLGGATLKEIERLIKEALGRGNFQLPASALTPAPESPGLPLRQAPPQKPAAASKPPARAPGKAPSKAVPPPATSEAQSKAVAPPAKGEAASKASAPVLPPGLSPDDGLEELQDVEEVDELDEVEELDSADEVEELDSADEVEELDSADEVEELDSADEVEELDSA
ncbi:MAG: hypothetical protein ACOYM2_07770, partial [Rectinemataceae bacterium]